MERDVLANAASRARLAPPGDDSTGGFDVGVVEGMLAEAAGVLLGWCLSKIQRFNLWRQNMCLPLISCILFSLGVGGCHLKDGSLDGFELGLDCTVFAKAFRWL